MLERRIHLIMFPYAEPQSTGPIEVAIPEGLRFDEDYMKIVISESLDYALIPRVFSECRRHRWKGLSQGMDEFLLLEASFGFVSGTYPSWVGETATGRKVDLDFVADPVRIGPMTLRAGPDDLLALESGEGLHADEIDAAVMPAPRRADKAESKPSSLTKNGEPLSEFERKKLEADHHRRKAMEFLGKSPLGAVIVSRQTLECVLDYQDALMRCGSDNYWLAERKRHAAALEKGEHFTPTYPLLDAARLTLERDFHAKWSLIFGGPELWDGIMPKTDMTYDRRGEATRMLSKLEGLVTAEIVEANKRMDVQLCLVLDPGDDVADRFTRMSLCRFGPDGSWSGGLWKQFRRSALGFKDPRCLATVRLQALLRKRHIVKMESQHASFRRQFAARGVQTHSVPFGDGDANFFLQKCRTHGDVPVLAGDVPGSSGDMPGLVEDRKEVHKYGGAWRCFIRNEAFGTRGKMDPKALGAKYRSLDDDEKQDLIERGRAATESRHVGASTTFGLTTKSLQAVHNRAIAERSALPVNALAVRTERLDMSARVDHTISAALGCTGRSNSVQVVLRVARAKWKRDAVKLSSHRAEEKHAYDAWLLKEKAQCDSLLKELLPGGSGGVKSSTISSLWPIPSSSQGEAAFEYRLDRKALCMLASALIDGEAHDNLQNSLDVDWTARHTTILHPAALEPAPKPKAKAKAKAKAAKLPPCDSELCLHGRVGFKAYNMRNAFIRFEKSAFPRGGPDEAQLVGSWVVFKLRGVLAAAVVALDLNPWADVVAELQQKDRQKTLQYICRSHTTVCLRIKQHTGSAKKSHMYAIQ